MAIWFETSRSTAKPLHHEAESYSPRRIRKPRLWCLLFSLVVAIGGSVWCWEDTIFRK